MIIYKHINDNIKHGNTRNNSNNNNNNNNDNDNDNDNYEK